MLIFTLKKEWYDKIRSGEKTVEYREVKQYWTTRLWHENCLPSNGIWSYEAEQKAVGNNWLFPVSCVLRLGYTKRQMTAEITKIEVVDGKDTDLRVDKPVYAIYLANVREAEE